jgi:hypothetical protein
MFSRPVKHVASTKILASHAGAGRQAIVYAMAVTLGEELAMVLPVPVPAGSADDALRFVDLSGYAGFFDDLEKAFPPAMLMASRGKGFGAPQASATLVVHEVGDFEASFVPRRADFARLDPRFRLPDAIWAALHRYDDWGFAVFKLKPKRGFLGLSAKAQSVHPMAFVFPSREPEALFFPTVHVHDGRLPATARFDHHLYAQADGLLGAALGWGASTGPVERYVDLERARGVLSPGPARHTLLVGDLPNDDLWLRTPARLTHEDLAGAGRSYRYRLTVASAFAPSESHVGQPGWWRTARERMPELRAALVATLRRFEAERAAAWGLVDYDEALPPHFFNGPKLMSGTSWQDAGDAGIGRPGRVDFGPWSPHFEPQHAELAFARVPDEPLASAIRQEITEAMEAAARG